jgi:hypothetical protein
MAEKSEKKTGFSLKKKILFSGFISVAVLVLAIEVCFRIIDVPGFDRYLLTLDHEKEARVIAHPYLGFMLKPGFKRDQFRHNSLGFRGPEITLRKPKGVYRIACIGGSSTYGHGPSSEHTTWPRLIETKLRKAYPGKPIQVINCGASGYSTFENMPNLALRIVDLQPDLIIIYQSINDMHCGVWPEEYKRDNRHWRAVFHIPTKSDLERVLEHSMTFLVYRWLFTDYMTMGDLAKATIVNFPQEYMPEKWHPEEIECFYRNLRIMVSVAREFGAEVLLSTQACYTRHLPYKSERQSMVRHGQAIKYVANRYQCYFVDNASEELMPKDPELFTKTVHLTDKGTQRLSDNFVRYIVENKILEKGDNN